jgi:hypothetical protein
MKLSFELVASQKEVIPMEDCPPPPFKYLDRFDGTAFPEYKVERLYCRGLNFLVM